MIRLAPFLLAALAFVVAAAPGDARTRHSARQPDQAAEAAPPEGPASTRQFYPQEIEGGSSGNLPFNNQIRKHTDPLNANGGR